MRRHTLYTTDELLKIIRDVANNDCKQCPIPKRIFDDSNHPGIVCVGDTYDCVVSVLNWMEEEVEEKPRYEVYTTLEEAAQQFKEFCKLHDGCVNCEYSDSDALCNMQWLYDKEVVK